MGHASAVVTAESAFPAFAASVRGRITRPGDDNYESARHVYNAMIDRKPRAIVQCADVADVIQCVNLARDTNMPLAIRGRGHTPGGIISTTGVGGRTTGGGFGYLSRRYGLVCDKVFPRTSSRPTASCATRANPRIRICSGRFARAVAISELSHPSK